jgi:hypothetical protein
VLAAVADARGITCECPQCLERVDESGMRTGCGAHPGERVAESAVGSAGQCLSHALKGAYCFLYGIGKIGRIFVKKKT